ncbi:MAG TPA: hypothetical protein VGP38_05150 [Rubrobacter sp.]|nr:hypothetical protein [Rubrobacter sp.]
MQEKRNLSRYCIYTLCHTGRLKQVHANTRRDEFEENRAWVTGRQLLLEAQENDEQMPVLFAAAEKEGSVLYYAFLESVDVDLETRVTRYAFVALTKTLSENRQVEQDVGAG